MMHKRTKILLLHSSFVNSNLAEPALRIAPLGLFYLSSSLESTGYRTKILTIKTNAFQPQNSINETYVQALTTKIQDFDPDYIGYSFRNLYVHDRPAREPIKLINFFYLSLEKPVIDFLRAITKARIIGGGSAFSLAPRLHMRHLGLDFGIVGEGEVAFEKLLSLLERGADITNLPGLTYKHESEIIVNRPRLMPDLSAIPAIDTADFEDYGSLYYENGGYGSIQTKRGCQFRCLYCVYPHLEGSIYRLRNIKTVCDEVLAIRDTHDVYHFFVVDSVFSFPTDHSVSFCEELLLRKANVKWAAYINPRGITKNVLHLYKRSGCQNLVIAPDTFSPRMLQKYQKDFSVEDVENCIELLFEVGIPFEVSLIIGGPGENEASVQETIRFCERCLTEVPVTFTNGLWLHRGAPAMELSQNEGHFPSGEDFRFDEVVLQNDFQSHSKLHYFFPYLSSTLKREEFLLEIFAQLRRHKWIVMGSDFSFEKETERFKYDKRLKVEPYARPWHRGMQGRMPLSK